LGSIDQALLHEFEVLTFMNGVPRKRGRTPRIDSIPNLRAETTGKEAVYYLNMENHPVTAVTGEIILPFKRNSKAVDASFEIDGEMGKVSFSIPVGQHKKFNRALHKIAFSSMAFFLGADEALDSKYDHIRNYVLHGGTCRPVLCLIQGKEEYRHEVFPPYKSIQGEFYFVHMIIAGIGFVVDLCPGLESFVRMKALLEQDRDFDGWWSRIPPENGSPS